MILFIAILLLAHFDMAWGWYILAVVLWIVDSFPQMVGGWLAK